MKFIELFAGIGGFRLGLEKANDTITEGIQQGIQQESKSNNTIVKSFLGTKQFTRDRNILQSKTSKGIQKTMSCIEEGETRFTCVYANEWNKYVCQIYRKNFGNKRMFNKDTEICQTTTKIGNKERPFGEQHNGSSEGQYDCPELVEGDIREIPTKPIPDHDLLTAGFPCQSFSIAGKRKGLNDTRGTLFFEICRIAEVKKPRLLLLENVKGLLNHERGNTFRIILDSLSELGYDCEWEVLNSKNFGVPQNRERVFIVGYLRETGRQKVFPLGEGDKMDNEEQRQIKMIQNSGKEIARVYDGNGLAPTIKGKTGGWQEPKIQVMHNLHHHRTGKYGNDIKQMNEPSFTLDSGSGRDLVITNKTSIRRLTPTECERLQGFPDGWTEGISDTQRYKCLGNAVTVNVIKEIGKKIAKVQQEIF